MLSLISCDNYEITHQRTSFTDSVMSHSVKPIVTVEVCIMVISCLNGISSSDGPCCVFVYGVESGRLGQFFFFLLSTPRIALKAIHNPSEYAP